MRTKENTRVDWLPGVAGFQREYARALAAGDLKGMVHGARRLYQAYALAGCEALARKWTDEYLRCLIMPPDSPPGGEEAEWPVVPRVTPSDLLVPVAC